MMSPTATIQTACVEEVAMRDRFLQGMSQLASPVSVVTTDGPGGRAGVTVSAVRVRAPFVARATKRTAAGTGGTVAGLRYFLRAGFSLGS